MVYGLQFRRPGGYHTGELQGLVSTVSYLVFFIAGDECGGSFGHRNPSSIGENLSISREKKNFMLPVVCMPRCKALRFDFEYPHAEVFGAVVLSNGHASFDTFNRIAVKRRRFAI